MKQRLIASYALNLIDLIFTLFLVSRDGIGIEGNPFGAYLIQNHMVIPVKVIVIGLIYLLIYRMDKHAHRAVNMASWVLFVVFMALCLYHGMIAAMII